MIVVDASVSLRWIYHEEGAPEARALLDRRVALIAPDLWLLEIGSAIGRRARKAQITREEAARHYGVLASTPIEFTALSELAGDAFRLALELGHPVYDCAYLALARRRSATLATADAEFAKVAARGGYGHLVELIGPDQP